MRRLLETLGVGQRGAEEGAHHAPHARRAAAGPNTAAGSKSSKRPSDHRGQEASGDPSGAERSTPDLTDDVQGIPAGSQGVAHRGISPAELEMFPETIEVFSYNRAFHGTFFLRQYLASRTG